ncbi:hypothetical protein [Variovorax sp. Varisp62]|uniref:hypothetical protein n=1 Tax=Variovorax sp. Varisp62 TaxID=3243049 RepID=UPI0039B381C0
MIKSADEFISLCNSKDESDIARSFADEAPLNVWEDLILNFRSHQIDVAQNRTIPYEVMKVLATQGDELVRSILAEKRRLPVDLFDFLSKDSSSLVRKKIAANKKAPADIVKNLAEDGDDDVARVARFRLNQV